MKKKIKYILLSLIAIILTGCTNSKMITEIDYSKLEELISNEDTFILEVVQTGCGHCEEFAPRFRAVLKEEGKEAYSINLYNLTKEEAKKFNELTTSVTGTPTVLFFKEGKETSNRIYGAVNNDKIKEFLEKTKK